MFIHGLGHALAELAIEGADNQAVRKVVDTVINRVIDADVDAVPEEYHPVMKEYAHRLALHLEERLAAQGGDGADH